MSSKNIPAPRYAHISASPHPKKLPVPRFMNFCFGTAVQCPHHPVCGKQHDMRAFLEKSNVLDAACPRGGSSS